MTIAAIVFLLFSALINSSNVLYCHGADTTNTTTTIINNGTTSIIANGTNSDTNATTTGRMGINYGTLGSNLLSPYRSIELIKAMNVGYVKLYNADPETLKLLAGTDLRVSIMVPNEAIPLIASNASMADQWILQNLLPYYPETLIRTITVGNDVLSNYNQELWNGLVPAMRFIRNSLKSRNIHNVKVGSPLAMDVLNSTFPPSNGTFREDLLPTIVSLLNFLNSSSSFFYLDVYPYIPWSAEPLTINLDFALFRGHLTYKDPGSRLIYRNLLDQMLDSVFFAMDKVGFGNVRIAIAETGWPHAGDVDEPGANVYNAATYNRNLIRKVMADPPSGTPARPGLVIPAFLSSLYDENLKKGPGTERHWGIRRADGTAVYEIDTTGARSNYGDQLPAADNNRPYRGELWCVVASEANISALGEAVADTCGRLNGTCEAALSPGKGCYQPVSVVWHASYAFSAYWAEFRSSGAHCHFNGLAAQTITDPSHGRCRFPSVTV